MGSSTGGRDNADRIGLNFIRPDVNRPGNFDFVNSGEWLVSQYVRLGVGWNRLAFSWVLVQPEPGVFCWDVYDGIVDSCAKAGIKVLATLGGHFDRPPVPAWAGQSLHEVVNEHPEYLERFVEAWAGRYRGRIQHWEILNEPKLHHKGLTVLEYAGKVLKPSYRIIKQVDPSARVVCCAYNNLPVIGKPEEFWDAARGHYDIHNYHQYQHWGYFLTDTSAAADEAELRDFRALMDKHGEGDKPFWVTEIGWWGTASITGSIHDIYKRFPRELALETRAAYTGREMLAHPVVVGEDARRAEWMKDLFPRILSIPGCEKAFLWVSLDEFEGGFDPEAVYGTSTDQPARQVDLWGIIAGDKTWRTSAFVLQEMLKVGPRDQG